jgi:amino acid adenylation domain-containing protein
MRVVFCISSPEIDVEPFLAQALELRRRGHSVSMVLSGHDNNLAADIPLVSLSVPFIAGGASGAVSIREFEERFPEAWREFDALRHKTGVLISPPDDPLCAVLCSTFEFDRVTVHCSLENFPAAHSLPGFASKDAVPAGETAAARQKQPEPVSRALPLRLYAVSRRLLPEPVTLPENAAVTGFCFREDEGLAVRPESNAVEAPVLIVLSAAHTDLEKLAGILLEGVRKAGRPALLHLAEETAWARQLAGDRVGVNFSSTLSSLLARAELVIHHGDAQVSAEVFRAGVPAVVVPYTAKQKSWAELARTHGCARNVIPVAQLNASRLAAAIQGTLVEGDFKRCAAELAKSIAEEKGAATACQAIEEWLERRRSDNAGALAIPPLQHANRESPLPLSFAQERLWFIAQLDPDSPAYNMPLGLRLKGKLDVEALHRTLIALVERHESLRTIFIVGDSGPQQKVLHGPHLDFKYDPACRLSEAEALQAAREEAGRPFRLERGPLIRAMVLRLDELDHVLVLNMHHIISDGWSVVVLVRELTAIYRAYVQGEQPQLPALPFQYADFAVWQRGWLHGKLLESELGYWRSQLEGSPALELATDYPRKPAASYRSGSVRVWLPPELLQQIKKAGQNSGSTLFIVLMAAFQTVLCKYSGQRDVATGTAIANRKRTELDAIVGFFVNTLVLRTSLAGDPEMREILKRVKRVALDAYRHQDLPFEKLVQELQPERLGTGMPFIQAMLILENTGPWELKFEGAEASVFMAEAGAAKLELMLSLREEDGALAGELVYARELYAAQTMKRLIVHWQRVLERMVAEPGLRMSDLCLLDEEEREQLLSAPNHTETIYPSLCVHTIIEKQARQTPDAVAVEFENRALTYSELERQANRVARHLRSVGVARESRVGVCLYRGLELLPVLLGILKCGAAYVPLDSAYPPERLAYMVEDSDVDLVVSGRGALPPALWDACRVIDLDKEWESVQRHSAESVGSEVLPQNMAYVIYTSGSTGRPKGVQISHAGLANFLFSMLHALELTTHDVVMAETALSFDIAGLELYLPLFAGARVKLLGRGTSMDAVELIREMNGQVTLAQATPATWQMVLDAGWKGNSGLKILCGGEALPLSLARRLSDSSSAAWNMYGPTETTVWSMMEKLPRGVEQVLIGRPIANTQVYVLDEGMHPVPTSVPGELYLGGAGLARSYWRRPELTAERLVPNPFNGAGERLYRTGDRVRWRPDGKLEFLDRLDNQVKVRGHRIELGEIEAVLNECENLRQGVVIVREDIPGEKYLAVYALPNNGHATDTAVLKNFLRRKLPEYMVPDVIVWMQELPLTPNGKIDRKRLPSSAAVSEQEYVAPRDAEEELLSRIWAEVLNRPRVGVRERFFDLGGHSLLATQVITKLRSLHNVEIPLQAIFEAPTIAELAERVRAARIVQPRPSVPLVKLKRRNASGPVAVDSSRIT